MVNLRTFQTGICPPGDLNCLNVAMPMITHLTTQFTSVDHGMNDTELYFKIATLLMNIEQNPVYKNMDFKNLQLDPNYTRTCMLSLKFQTGSYFRNYVIY